MISVLCCFNSEQLFFVSNAIDARPRVNTQAYTHRIFSDANALYLVGGPSLTCFRNRTNSISKICFSSVLRTARCDERATKLIDEARE